MDLTQADVQRLSAHTSVPAASYGGRDDQPKLDKDSDGFCVFLDADCRCQIYAHRPESCRSYPLIPERYHGCQLDVDYSCPGIGRGLPLNTRQDLMSSLTQRSQSEGQQSVAALAGDMLRHQGRYIEPALLPIVATALSMEDALARVCLERLPDVGNVLEAGEARAHARRAAVCVQLQESRQGVSSNPRVSDSSSTGRTSVQLALADPMVRSHLEQADPMVRSHLEQGIWNTQLDGESVTIYRLLRRGNMLLHRPYDRGASGRGDPISVSIEEMTDLDWTPPALERMAWYMRVWMRRQLSVRFSHAMALADAFHHHMVHHYLGLLQSVRHQVVLMANAVGHLRGSQAITEPVVLEAIRGTDAPMRAECANTHLQPTSSG